MAERYTRREVGRILGLDAGRLRYWEKLGLIRPRARWGERFYSFGDLVALRSIRQLTERKIPARRLRRAVDILEKETGQAPLPIERLRLLDQGQEIVAILPGNFRPFNPLRRQWLLPFGTAGRAARLQSMTGRTAEELFEIALDAESRPGCLAQAADLYERVIQISPEWIEAHINLGVVLYQMGHLEEALAAFRSALALDPSNPITCYNLGCVLEELGELVEAIGQLRRAARLMPANPDIRFNLALAYEKRGRKRLAREQWALYLRYAPHGPWAEQARTRLAPSSARQKPSPPIPFPRGH